MGFDLDAFLDEPLGYSQSNGTIELRERLAATLSGRDGRSRSRSPTARPRRTTSIALSQLRPGDDVAMEVPNYMQMPGVARSLGADGPDVPPASGHAAGSRTGTSSSARSRRETRLLYLSNPNNPTGSVLSDAAMARIVERCEQTGTWLLSDEVYLGAEIDGPRTTSFWGMSDRVIVTSGLSKAYGIPGVRIGWIVGPPTLVADVLDAARLHHDRPEQDVGPHRARRRRARRIASAATRARARILRAQPADRPRVGRRASAAA